MSVSSPEFPVRRSGAKRFVRPLVIFLLVGAATLGAAALCDVDAEVLAGSLHTIGTTVALGFPPDFSVLPELLEPAATTILLAAVATPFGVALSFGFGLAAARNLSPPWLRGPARLIIGLERALPEIILILLLVAALGIGPFPGVVALAVGSIGMLGKLIADAIEEIDPRSLEAVSCVGATRWQLIRYGVIPEILPSLLANSIFRFEVNLRASVLLGAVGAGGIGMELFQAMNLLEYREATVIILVTLALVFGAERLSDALRRRVLQQGRLVT